MNLARRSVLALSLILAAPGARGARGARAATLEQVMRDLSAVRERHARFTELKELPELDTTLPSQGTLAWFAPDRLEKHTTWPIDERLSVTGDRLVYERPDRGVRQAFALAEQPEMQALVEAIRGTLAGDLAGLLRHYDIGFGPADTGWRMVLTPVSGRLREAVTRIVILGAGTNVTGVDTEGGGGVTRMRILPAP